MINKLTFTVRQVRALDSLRDRVRLTAKVDFFRTM